MSENQLPDYLLTEMTLLLLASERTECLLGKKLTPPPFW